MEISRMIRSTKAESFGDTMKDGPVFHARLFGDKRDPKATNGISTPANAPTPFDVAFGAHRIGRDQIDRLDSDDAVPLNTVGGHASCALAENCRGANCGCVAVACRRSGRDAVGMSCIEAAAKAVANG